MPFSPGQASPSQVPETQLSTEQIMHELSSGVSEVQFRRGRRAGEVLSTRPGVKPFGSTVAGKVRIGMV